jgi:uncharacterized membrane protein YhiD involved in acid resistance
MPPNIDINSILVQPEVTALLRIVLAGFLGGLIGLERELAGKAAGIRTYGLVGVGSAMFTVVAIYGFGAPEYASRIIGSIIIGIGFLGAGTILHTKVNIVGLTTAAGLWVVAGVGMAIGSGLYLIGVGAGVTVFILLQFAGPEEYIRSRRARAGKVNAAEEDEVAESGLEERLKHAPGPTGAPQPQPPMPEWPASVAPPPVNGPWSTTVRRQPGQTDRR